MGEIKASVECWTGAIKCRQSLYKKNETGFLSLRNSPGRGARHTENT